MLFIIIPVVIILIGVIWDLYDDWGWGEGLIVVGGIFLFFTIIAVPIARLDIYTDIAELDGFTQTIESARVNDFSELERATITQGIAEWNGQIMKLKFLKSKKAWFGIYIPEQVNELKLLE